jgi:nitroimidazol reductase NimA-like FMN-containing flavoprotein (pyridoxamine 5'-phosphate oxidase superfamily)
MIRELTESQIDGILRRERIGRIGSTAVGHVQITPIIYGYDGESIYGHSRFGRKIQYMRGNPEVCFEVEEIVDPTSWRVVELTGSYEELADLHDRDRAMRLILAQAGGGPESAAVQVERGEDLVVYRIRITKRSGRQEGGIEDA